MKTTEKISLKLTNNTPIKQSVSILGGQQSSFENANNNVLVQWDISGETFATNEVTLKLPTPITKLYTGSNIKGVVESLNTMGVATFSYEGTIIYATNLLDEDVQTSNLCVGDEFTFFIGSGFNNTTFAFEIDAARGVLVGGDFTTYNGNVSNYIVRLLEDGTYDAAFSIGTGFNGRVLVISKQTDGKILVGGEFTDYNGTAANRIIRLNSDGSIDGTFVYGTGFNWYVYSIEIQSDGKILLGGAFTSYKGGVSNYIIRLNSDGTVDGTFAIGTGFVGGVQSMDIQSDDKIVVAGNMITYNGTAANRIIRLNSDGSIDGTFVYGTGFNGSSMSVKVQGDNKIVVGGLFTDYNGTAANRIIRLNSDGSIDGTFVYGTGFNGSVSSVILQALTENTILVGGSFNTYNGVIVQKIVRLLNNGSIDATFPTSNAFDNDIQLLKLHFSGKILVSGSFANYKGVNYNRIIRLNTDASSDTTTA